MFELFEEDMDQVEVKWLPRNITTDLLELRLTE